MDVLSAVALGVAILFDPVFAFLCLPLLSAHQSNQVRTTILIAAALAALYSYRLPSRTHLAPIDLLLGQEHAEKAEKCFMLGFRVALVLSALMIFAGVNAGRRSHTLAGMLGN